MKAATDIALSSKRNGKQMKAKFDLPHVTAFDNYYLDALKEVSHVWSRALPAKSRQVGENASTSRLEPLLERKRRAQIPEDVCKQKLEQMIKSVIWSKVENQLDLNFQEMCQAAEADNSETLFTESSLSEIPDSKAVEVSNEDKLEELLKVVSTEGTSTPTSTESPVSSISRDTSPLNPDQDDSAAILRFKKYSNIIRTRNRGKINDPFKEESVDYAERPDDAPLTPNAVCGEVHCFLGCVCDSVKSEFVRQDCCGLIECIFNCTCKPVLLSFSGNDDEAKPVFAFVAQRPKRNIRPPSKISDFAVITSTYQRRPKDQSDSNVKFEISPRRKLTLLGHDAKKKREENQDKVPKRALEVPRKNLSSSSKDIERLSSPKLQKPEVPLKKILLDKMSQKSSAFSPQLTAWLLRQQKQGNKVKRNTKTKSPVNSDQVKIETETTSVKKGFRRKEQAQKVKKIVAKSMSKKTAEKPKVAEKVQRKSKKATNVARKKERSPKFKRKKKHTAVVVEAEEEMIDLLIDGSDEGDDFLDHQNEILNSLLDSVISEMPPDTPSSAENINMPQIPNQVHHAAECALNSGVVANDKILKPSLVPVDAFFEAALQEEEEELSVNTELTCREESSRSYCAVALDEIPEGNDTFELKYPFMRRGEYITEEDKMKCARTDSVNFLRSCARCRPVSSRYFAKNRVRAKQTEIMEKWRAALLEQTLVAVEEGEETSDQKNSTNSKVKNEKLEKVIDECKDFSQFESKYVYLNGDCVEIFSNCNWSSKRLKIYETIIRHMSDPSAFKIRLGVFSVEIIGDGYRKGSSAEKLSTHNGIKTPSSMDDVIKTVLIRDCSRSDFTSIGREASPKTPEEKPNEFEVDLDLVDYDSIGANSEKQDAYNLIAPEVLSVSPKSEISESSNGAKFALCDEKLSDMPNLDKEANDEADIRKPIHLYKCMDISRSNLNSLLAKRNHVLLKKSGDLVDSEMQKTMGNDATGAKDTANGSRKLMVLSRLEKTVESSRAVTKYRSILPRVCDTPSGVDQISSSKRRISESELTDSEDSDVASTKCSESVSNNNDIELDESSIKSESERCSEMAEMYFKAPNKVRKVGCEERNNVSRKTRSTTSGMVKVTPGNSFTVSKKTMNADIARAISKTWLQHANSVEAQNRLIESVYSKRIKRSNSVEIGPITTCALNEQLNSRQNKLRNHANDETGPEYREESMDTVSVDSGITGITGVDTGSLCNSEPTADSVFTDETATSSLGSWSNPPEKSSSESQPSSPGSNASSTKCSTEASNSVGTGKGSCDYLEMDALAANVRPCCTNSVVSWLTSTVYPPHGSQLGRFLVAFLKTQHRFLVAFFYAIRD